VLRPYEWARAAMTFRPGLRKAAMSCGSTHCQAGLLRAGPRPTRPEQLYDANLPAVESMKAVRHFRHGPQAYEGEAYSPWKTPITGPYYRVS